MELAVCPNLTLSYLLYGQSNTTEFLQPMELAVFSNPNPNIILSMVSQTQ
jgi:hypothetical protein